MWLELDALLQALGEARTAGMPRVAVPTQVLGLLPPPPASGWPATFGLAPVAAELADAFEAAVEGGKRTPEQRTFVPVDPRYPALRRAERLSWAVWSIIGGQTVGVNSHAGSPLQAVIEEEGTADRLRRVLLRLRELREMLRQ